MDQALKSKLQLYFINSIKNLDNNNNSSPQNVLKLLKTIEFINERECENEQFQLEFKDYSKSSIQKEFNRSFYSICLSQLLTNFNPNLNAQDSSLFSACKELFLKIISISPFSDSFNVIYDLCFSLSPSQQRDFCVFLMKQFINRHLMKALFTENSQQLEDRSSNLVENEIIQRVLNLPDKYIGLSAQNNTIEKKNDIFLPRNYFKLISADLWSSLESMKSSGKQFNMQFISNVFGKISFLGYSEVLNELFLKNLIQRSYISEEWRKISNDLFSSISANYLESSLVNLINFSSSYSDLSNVISDLILSNSNVRYYFIDKFIFLKMFKKENAIQNVIGYLHESKTRRNLYYELFKKLLDAWSTKASIVNTSHEQHLYLTKCIVVCVSFMDESDRSNLANDLLRPILQGVEKHLCSPIEKVRILGMLVGENLMNDLTFAGQGEDLKKLKFDYEKTDEVKSLIELRKKPDSASKFEPKSDEISLEALNNEAKTTNKPSVTTTLFENDKIKITQTDKDSDDDEDDLVAYDLSNDIPLAKTNKPAYLRDCLDALIFSEDPDKIEISLKSVENLCETYHYELQEISVELVKVLLHKSNAYSIENFEELKANAMICVTVHYPIECAQFLTSQFYEQGYSLVQRNEILHVIVMSAQKLSSPNEEPIFDRRILEDDEQRKKASSISSLLAFNRRPALNDDWHEAVQKRIAAKTKIKKTATKSQVKSKENKYSDVYGHFFFPLLNPYDKKRVHLNMIEQEYELLGKMIFSLAVVVYSAANTTVVENMINSFTDFLWAVRNHVEPFVRKALIFGFTIVLMTVSDTQLFTSLTNYFVELKFWLQNVATNDPDYECQKRAYECLSLLAQRVKGKLFGANNN